MKSIGAMIKQLHALLGTDDLSDWEHNFVTNLSISTKTGTDTVRLTAAQVGKIEQIYSKHFGD